MNEIANAANISAAVPMYKSTAPHTVYDPITIPNKKFTPARNTALLDTGT